jgi:hypothetical protein
MCFYKTNTVVRVVREYPNPNPKFRVPEFSGIVKLVVISGIDSQNPKFKITELPDPKFSGNSNAHPYIAVVAIIWPEFKINEII